MFIFPGMGLGATLCGARRISDEMFYTAAEALAGCVSEEEMSKGQVFPSVSFVFFSYLLFLKKEEEVITKSRTYVS